jgi:hypothetical protein
VTSQPFVVLGNAPALVDAVTWYALVSGGAAALAPEILPVDEPEGGWGTYAERGGLGRPPRNSQVLIDELMKALPRVPRSAAGGVVVVTPPGAGIAPHAWRFRGGGFWVGGRTWLRRYAFVPADAATGVLAHELGHLLFGWSDHDRASGLGADCLMGTGAAGDNPARPCAPSRVGAGWVRAVPATRSMRVADLEGGVVRTGDRLVELGPSGDLLVYRDARVDGRIRADPGRSVLALVASATRWSRATL